MRMLKVAVHIVLSLQHISVPLIAVQLAYLTSLEQAMASFMQWRHFCHLWPRQC